LLIQEFVMSRDTKAFALYLLEILTVLRFIIAIEGPANVLSGVRKSLAAVSAGFLALEKEAGPAQSVVRLVGNTQGGVSFQQQTEKAFKNLCATLKTKDVIVLDKMAELAKRGKYRNKGITENLVNFFVYYDANGNGEVDLDEFRAMVRASALAKDSLWWRLGLMKIFQRLFLEPLSFITSVMTRGAEKAYTHWYLNWSPRARREKRIAASVFVEADVNKDGAVSYDELEARVGKRIEEKELRTLFDGADRDRNGALDKREFRSSQSLRSRLASIFT